ncbi:hypothetical protein AN1V17_51410 [Vallitalea sediminicola]
MNISYRKYKDINDYESMCTFLEKNYQVYGTKFYNNLTLFEFQCALACGRDEVNVSIDEALSNFLLWFDGEELVGMVDGNSFCIASDYRFLFDDIIKAAEEINPSKDIECEWEIYEGDSAFESVLQKQGYIKSDEYWVRRELNCNNLIDDIDLPEGFHYEYVSNLSNLDEVFRAYKLCYGMLFNQNIFDNFFTTSTYRRELDLVVKGPDGSVVAICSGRYDEKNKLATIEAVSCYHEYRKKGISRALQIVLLRNAKKLGAEKATVFTAMPEKYPAPNKLYESVGFNLVGNLYVWRRGNK